MCSMQYKHVMCSVQYSVCSMKCTGGGGGAVRSVQCAVCSTLPYTGEDLAVQIRYVNI